MGVWGGGIEPCADCAQSGIWWDKPVGNHSPDVPTVGTTAAPNCSQWLETFPPTSSQWGDVGRTPVPIGNFSWPRNLAVWENTMVLVVCWSIGEFSWGRNSPTRDRNFRTWGNLVEPKVSYMGKFRGHGNFHCGSVARPTFSHWDDFGWGMFPTIGNNSGQPLPNCGTVEPHWIPTGSPPPNPTPNHIHPTGNLTPN